MKGTVKVPGTSKGWLSLLLIVFVIFIGGWPVISMLNKPIIIFGMPLLMAWSILIIFLTTFVMWLINKIGGFK